MQLIIEINQPQDLQILLPLLERLKIVYKQVPSKKNGKSDKAPMPFKLSEKYSGKLSEETNKALQQHIEESRNEWERSI